MSIISLISLKTSSLVPFATIWNTYNIFKNSVFYAQEIIQIYKTGPVPERFCRDQHLRIIKLKTAQEKLFQELIPKMLYFTNAIFKNKYPSIIVKNIRNKWAHWGKSTSKLLFKNKHKHVELLDFLWTWISSTCNNEQFQIEENWTKHYRKRIKPYNNDRTLVRLQILFWLNVNYVKFALHHNSPVGFHYRYSLLRNKFLRKLHSQGLWQLQKYMK